MSVFLIEQLITRYSEITYSLLMRQAKVQINHWEMMFLLLGEFLDINFDLNSNE